MLGEIGIGGQKFILVFFRTAAVLWLLPVFSSRAVSVPFKAGLSLLIAFLLFETIEMAPAADPYAMFLLIMKETLVGIAMGFFVRLLFTMAYAAGEVMSMQSGFGFARFMDPSSMSYMSVLEQFQNLFAIMIFFAIDAHHMVLSGLAQSFRLVPLGTASLQPALLYGVTKTTGHIFSVALKIGAPVIVTLFLVELALGLLSRMIPQINVFVEGLPLKIILALFMLSVSLNLIAPIVAGLFKGMDVQIIRLFRAMV